MSHPIRGAVRPAPAAAAAAPPATAAPNDTSSFIPADAGSRETSLRSADGMGIRMAVQRAQRIMPAGPKRRGALARPAIGLDDQIGWTLSAWGPLVPWLAVYSTRWLS